MKQNRGAKAQNGLRPQAACFEIGAREYARAQRGNVTVTVSLRDIVLKTRSGWRQEHFVTGLQVLTGSAAEAARQLDPALPATGPLLMVQLARKGN
ncbi:MAG TPA: hypothetical protein VEK08_26840 [Planctomycetota bacterium]|nr:hypothetical protein [Planctomycetota bacterium]